MDNNATEFRGMAVAIVNSAIRDDRDGILDYLKSVGITDPAVLSGIIAGLTGISVILVQIVANLMSNSTGQKIDPQMILQQISLVDQINDVGRQMGE